MSEADYPSTIEYLHNLAKDCSRLARKGDPQLVLHTLVCAIDSAWIATGTARARQEAQAGARDALSDLVDSLARPERARCHDPVGILQTPAGQWFFECGCGLRTQNYADKSEPERLQALHLKNSIRDQPEP